MLVFFSDGVVLGAVSGMGGLVGGCSVSFFRSVKRWFWSGVSSLVFSGWSVVGVCWAWCSMVSLTFWSIHDASSGLMLGRYSGNWLLSASSSVDLDCTGLMRVAGWGLTLPFFVVNGWGFLLAFRGLAGFSLGFLVLRVDLVNVKRCFFGSGVFGSVVDVVFL